MNNICSSQKKVFTLHLMIFNPFICFKSKCQNTFNTVLLVGLCCLHSLWTGSFSCSQICDGKKNQFSLGQFVDLKWSNFNVDVCFVFFSITLYVQQAEQYCQFTRVFVVVLKFQNKIRCDHDLVVLKTAKLSL